MFGLPFFRRKDNDKLILGRLGPFSFSPHFHIPTSARASHLYVIGLSGTGKSKFLEYLLYQDIAAGRGCGLIDPHSLLVDDLFRLLITRGVLNNPEILEKIIYVDPARTDFIIPFNVLATEANHPYDIAASVLEAFRRTWPESLREAPHFSNIVIAALIVLIKNGLTLIDMPPLLTNKELREHCLEKVDDRNIIEFFHDRFDQWGKEAPIMRESTLNKIGAFSFNPRLKLMLGQKTNNLDFRKIMDEGKILLLDLGHSDGETNRLIGSLVVTGFEMAMRQRRNQNLWNLTIDEFAGYVANEGSEKTLAHVFSESRKFRMSMTVAHQDLSQLTPRMLGALSNVQTKVIFGIGRPDAEYFAKLIGYVDPEAIKREPNNSGQYELFSSLPEQWEKWIEKLRFQASRQAVVACRDGEVVNIRTVTIPTYSASKDQIDEICRKSGELFGIPYSRAVNKLQMALPEYGNKSICQSANIPSVEMVVDP